MKMILFIVALLPFVSFGSFEYDGYTVERMRFYYWTDYLTTPSSSRVPTVFPGSFDELRSTLMSSTFGLCVNLSANISQKLSIPSSVASPSSFVQGSSTKTTITNSLYVVSNGVGYVVSPMIYPDLASVYQSVAMLYFQGYRGSGIVDDFSNGVIHCINVNYPLLVSDVLCSTNTVFRQILLNHLSSISTSVQNIELNVTGLQSSIEEGNNTISNIDVNVSSIDSNLVSLSSNTVAGLSSVSSSLSSLENIGGSISSVVDIFHSDFAMNNLEVFLGDDTQTWIDFLNLCQSSGLLSSDDVSSYISELQATDPSRSKSYTIPMQHRRFYVKNQIKHTCVEAQKLRGRYQSFYQQVNNPDTVVSRAVRELLYNHVSYPINSGFSSTIGDWRDELRQQLQDWKHSDQTGYLNVRDFQRRNFEAPVPGSTNTVPFYSFLTNNITSPITNEVRYAANNISSNIVEEGRQMRSLLNDTLFNDEFQGVNVRIKYPLYGQSSEAVHVHDDGLDQVNVALEDLTDVMLGLSDSLPSDILSSISNAVYQILFSITNRNSYLLLDHYSDYISNGVYSSSVSLFSEDFPNVYSNLTRYGLSDDNFWTLFGSTLLHHNEFIGSLLSDINEVRRFADVHLEDGVLGTAFRSADSVPSVEDVESKIEQLTNAVNSISFDSLTNLVSSFSNSLSSALSPYDRGDDLPSEIEFLVLRGSANDPGHVFTIPVAEHAEVWSLIRLSMGLALCLVNLILLPKFILRVVRLYVRLFWGALSLPK